MKVRGAVFEVNWSTKCAGKYSARSCVILYRCNDGKLNYFVIVRGHLYTHIYISARFVYIMDIFARLKIRCEISRLSALKGRIFDKIVLSLI